MLKKRLRILRINAEFARATDRGASATIDSREADLGGVDETFRRAIEPETVKVMMRIGE